MKKKIFILGAILVMILPKALGQVISVGQVVYTGVTIANGATASAVVTTKGMQLVGCQMPPAFTGTSISFVAATTLTAAYQPMHNTSGLLSYSVAANRYVNISPTEFAGVQFFKIVSGSTEGAARLLICSMKGM